MKGSRDTGFCILYTNPSKWKPFLLGEIKEAIIKQASSEDSEVFVETSLDQNSTCFLEMELYTTIVVGNFE